MSATTTARKPAAKASKPAAKAAPAKAKAVRVEHAAEVTAVKTTVGTVARQAKEDGHGDALALALRAFIGHQSYRPVGATVLWSQADHSAVGGEGTPATGAPMVAMIEHIGAALAALPPVKPASEQGKARKAARAALDALASVLG